MPPSGERNVIDKLRAFNRRLARAEAVSPDEKKASPRLNLSFRIGAVRSSGFTILCDLKTELITVLLLMVETREPEKVVVLATLSPECSSVPSVLVNSLFLPVKLC